MVIRLRIGKTGHVLIRQLVAVEVPNAFGGLGDIVFQGEVWTGEAHIYGNLMRVALGSCTRIETRRNDYETQESWKIKWRAPQIFAYKPYYRAAYILKRYVIK